MFKFILLATILPTAAMAHVNKCPHTHKSKGQIIWECNGEGLGPNPQTTFTAIGRICSSPTIDQNGDLITTHRDHAEKLADQIASNQCYPFQYTRVSQYEYHNTNEECQSMNPSAIRETVQAEYSCAR